jgi:hypothetical protein
MRTACLLRRRLFFRRGSVYPEHPFTKKCIVDLPAELPVPVRLFIAWLVIVFWKREAKEWPPGF